MREERSVVNVLASLESDSQLLEEEGFSSVDTDRMDFVVVCVDRRSTGLAGSTDGYHR